MAQLTKEQAGQILANLKGKLSDDLLLQAAAWVDSMSTVHEDQLSLKLSLLAFESDESKDNDFLLEFHDNVEAAGIGDSGSIFGAGRPAAQLVAETVVGAVAMAAGTAPLSATARVPGLAARFNPAIASQTVLQRAARHGAVAGAGVAGAIVANAISGGRAEGEGGGADAAASPDSTIPLAEAARRGGPLTVTQNGQVVELPGGFDAASIVAGQTQSTFTEADMAYMNQAGLGEASFAPEFLTGRKLTPDTAEIAFSSTWKQGVPRAAPLAQYRSQGRYPVIKRYSFREALNLPETLSDTEILAWTEKLWEGGFYSPGEGFDLTKPFSDQVAGDRYDPRFRSAWNEFLAMSLQNPTKTATQILDERRKLRRPLIDKARQEAMDRMAKEAVQRLRLPDPASISESAESTMQRLLGRDPTDAERMAIMERVTAAYAEEAKRAIADESVTSEIDVDARVEQLVESRHGAELEATEMADAFTTFTQMLGPGGPFGG